MSLYTKLILDLTKCDAADAPLVEGIMRSVCSTLDGLDRPTFRREAKKALVEVRRDRGLALDIARSYGLVAR